MDTLVQLNDSVEFKSLPSGLHVVKEDLVYDCLVASTLNNSD